MATRKILLIESLNFWNLNRRKKRRRVIDPWEYWSLDWLAKEIKVNKIQLANVITIRRQEFLQKDLYRRVKIKKSKGGIRNIFVPHPDLLRIQRAVNKHILKELPRHPCSFGFSGGNIIEAIKPHLKNKVLFSFDVVDAFGQVCWNSLWKILKRNFSLPITRILLNLAIWDDELPQGSAISPRLFDLAFYDVDSRIERLARKLGGAYTRYADNIFFSVPMNNFSAKWQSAVLRRVRWMTGRRIYCHEFSVRRLDKGGAVRILGFNIVNKKIIVPRNFKRNLRLSIHHLNYLIDNGCEYYKPWLLLQGQMAFANLGTLPASLLEAYLKLQKRIEDIYFCT